MTTGVNLSDRAGDSSAASASGLPPEQAVQVLLPDGGSQPVGSLMADLNRAEVTLPFAAERVAFLADLSTALRRRNRDVPQIAALAFWLRPAELGRLHDEFERIADDRVLLMPRGTVFHVPPANVDTIFVYSLALALLTGNRNIVRLSQRSLTAAAAILDTMQAVIAEHPEVADSLRIVSYGHDDAVSAALTRASDVRVLWGGDATIAAFRRLPLPPHGTELAFADRFSMAAIRTDAYSALAGEERDALADRFVNDTYWFDQLGCSSARLLVWAGGSRVPELAQDFHARVRGRAAAKRYRVDTAAAIGKMGQAFRSMIDGTITGYHWYDNTEVVLDTATFPPARGDFCGAGLFYQWAVPDLTALRSHIERQDQTLAVFGFSDDELRSFALALRGRGIDRIVPIGEALNFSRFWDGHDLLQSFTRRVTLP